MRKSGKGKNRAQKKKSAFAKNTNQQIDTQKRKSLSTLRNSAIGLVVLGGASAYFYQAYQSDLEERDLTKIGKGKPTVVQIHDPNCQLCTALQKETRKAVSNFEDGDLEFLVANIQTQKGRAFANQHNAPHVTLLLFDKRGKLLNTLQGVRQEQELTTVFENLIGKR